MQCKSPGKEPAALGHVDQGNLSLCPPQCGDCELLIDLIYVVNILPPHLLKDSELLRGWSPTFWRENRNPCLPARPAGRS